ncbi:MAG: GLPGLI family protein [Bacteroides sp.]|nr:GLPGLI family protein [Bacteroides sp.]
MKAKQRFTLCCLLMLAVVSAVRAQKFTVFMPDLNVRYDTIDRMQLRVQYHTTFCIDTTRRDKPEEEPMILEVGRKRLSKFYSYKSYLSDSIYQADVAKNVSREEIAMRLSELSTSAFGEIVYKGTPAGCVTTQQSVGGFHPICYEEPLELPHWTLTQATDTVMGMACLQAECDFRGRHWTASYTPDIALSEGPWKLCGLPGLILKAEDSDGDYRFVATGLEQERNDRPILIRVGKYEQMSRKQYFKVCQRFHDDPMGFFKGTQPGTDLTVKDENGQEVRPRGLPYNPLERE